MKLKVYSSVTPKGANEESATGEVFRIRRYFEVETENGPKTLLVSCSLYAPKEGDLYGYIDLKNSEKKSNTIKL